MLIIQIDIEFFLTGKLTIYQNIAMAATFDIQIPRE
jgi:hypothetical protein